MFHNFLGVLQHFAKIFQRYSWNCFPNSPECFRNFQKLLKCTKMPRNQNVLEVPKCSRSFPNFWIFLKGSKMLKIAPEYNISFANVLESLKDFQNVPKC